MSWSASAKGSKKDVRDSIAQQFDDGRSDYYKCEDPEETLRQKIGVLALAAIDANPDNTSIKVGAYGSAYTVDGVQINNSFSLTVSAS
jgi:hypothetical protein